MAYRVAALKNFERELRKMTKKNAPLKKHVGEAVADVTADPSIGEPYERNLFGLHKVKFPNVKRPPYRLVYAYYECCQAPDSCKYAEVELSDPEEGEVPECQGLIEFISVANRKDAEKLYRKDPTYIQTLIRK